MLYIHSFSKIEQFICRELMRSEPVSQIDVHSITDRTYLDRITKFKKHSTLLYSFQNLEFYGHLASFVEECDKMKILIDYIKEYQFKNIILLSYPGAYANSDNLYLQHKGIIEQMICESNIPACILRVQGICSPALQINNFHHLFYQQSKHQYVLPKKSNSIVYSVNLKNISDIILKAIRENHQGQFDVFDRIGSLSQFLHYNSPPLKIAYQPSFLLYLNSYLGKYSSPTMFELFLRTNVPMYNFRAEKEFGISLDANILKYINSPLQQPGVDSYARSKRELLLPAS